MNNYIWSIDISLSNSGVCIFDKNQNIIEIFSIKTNPNVLTQHRLRYIYDRLNEKLSEYPCDVLVLENGFTKFNTATQMLYRVHGVVNMLFDFCSQVYYAPTTIKKAITGDGKSNKVDVKIAVKQKYPNVEFNNEDESDAVAIGLTYFMKGIK